VQEWGWPLPGLANENGTTVNEKCACDQS
jgi:putative Mg2+ transporter-C (MgtC) family protein